MWGVWHSSVPVPPPAGNPQRVVVLAHRFSRCPIQMLSGCPINTNYNAGPIKFYSLSLKKLNHAPDKMCQNTCLF